MELGLLGQAAGMFAATNVDDMLVLAVFFGQAAGKRAAVLRVVGGQYVGFGAVLLVSVIGALGAGLLPVSAIPYLGLLPLVLGVRAAWNAYRAGDGAATGDQGAGMLQVAAVTFANGGDNIGVYVPVFAAVGVSGMLGYVVVFLVGVALWCAVGWLLAGQAVVANVLSRWGQVILPVVLIGIGLVILIEGGVFGL